MSAREAESLSPLFKNHKPDNNDLFLLLSPSDKGVRLNKGRNGARFAPKAIINQLKKLNAHKHDLNIHQKQVFFDTQDFEKDQLNSAHQILEILQSQTGFSRTVHIGGGHDHVFSLIKAIESLPHIEQICVINLDAHLDTRVDNIHHSGTPFRNLDNCLQKPCSLLQVGIQDFANSTSTFSKLINIKQDILSLSEFLETTNTFTTKSSKVQNFLDSFNPNSTFFLMSLDMDVIDGTQIKGVSAVNPMGLPCSAVSKVLEQFLDLSPKYFSLGIYEYNPVYDDLSNLGVRYIAQLIYNFMK